MFGMEKDTKLEAAVSAVRDEAIDPAAQAGAVARVRAALEDELSGAGVAQRIGGCADVQALFAAERTGQLDRARSLLVRDHLSECATCRVEWERPGEDHARSLPWRREDAAGPHAGWGGRWLAAAAAVGALAAVTTVGYSLFWGSPDGAQARIVSASGALHAIAVDGTVGSIQPGMDLDENEPLRTTRGGHAVVTLRDGSSVEMDERAQFSVSSRGLDTTIHLDRGNIIVKAAKRRLGHLYVRTADCRVAVTGTVFSVSHGLAGSRVSVVEGEVHVDHAGRESVLTAGQQAVTSPAVEPVPVAQDIAWSREREAHLALLGELAELGKQWEALPGPGLRHASRLMPLVPEDAAVYVALPNYGKLLGDGYELFKQRLEESEALSAFWDKHVPESERAHLDELVAGLGELSGHIGEEVVIAVRGSGQTADVLLLAETRGTGLRGFLEQELERLAPGKPLPVRFVDAFELGGVAAEKDRALALVTDDVVAVASRPATLREVVARQAAASGFAATSLGQQVQAAYARGAEVLVAADVEGLTGRKAADLTSGRAPLSTALKEVIAERRSIEKRTQNSVLFTFAGPRAGLSSWLASPGPMGSLDFVSPEAGGAAAFIIKSPSALLDEMLARAGDPAGAEGAIAQLEADLDVRLREDVVGALGSEVAVALDGPLLPVPSWKLIVEVQDADRLARSIERLAQFVSDNATRDGREVWRLDREESGGRVFYALRAVEGGIPLEAHFTFVDGYLVAGPSRALLMKAIETHASGFSLARSDAFEALLPADGDPYYSGILYQNAGVVLGPLAEMLAGRQSLGPDTQEAMTALAERSRPSVITLRGEPEAIRVAAVGAIPGLDASSLALPALFSRTFGGTRHPALP